MDAEMLLQTDEEEALQQQASRVRLARRGGAVIKIVGIFMVVLAVGVGAALFSSRGMMRSESKGQAATSLYEMVVVKPKNDDCAKYSEDCLGPRCCAVTGYTCFKNRDGMGKCMKECTPGGTNGTCEGVAPHMKPAEGKGLSLFCFAVYTENTGSTKVSHELTLLQQSKALAASIFSCADWAVYSDVVADLGDGDWTTQVHDLKNDFYFAKRKTAHTWINTGMFAQVWSAISGEGKAQRHNWVVKVDADAVFFPQKLINILQQVAVPEGGVYMENCKFVEYGYFGNLEVFSKEAWQRLTNNLEHCYDTLPWKVGVHHGKYGPMGEDMFAQQCMDLIGVAKQENFGLTTDGACEADRPEGQKKNKMFIPDCNVATPSIHPFKEPAAWKACWDVAKNA